MSLGVTDWDAFAMKWKHVCVVFGGSMLVSEPANGLNTACDI